MKKIENITFLTMKGVAFKKDAGKDWRLVDMAITALEAGRGLGFKVYRLGQKLISMQEVDAPDLILEDAEVEHMKKAINSCAGANRQDGVTWPDFIIDQAIEAIEAATEHRIDVK
jgi:hypothetical protein